MPGKDWHAIRIDYWCIHIGITTGAQVVTGVIKNAVTGSQGRVWSPVKLLVHMLMHRAMRCWTACLARQDLFRVHQIKPLMTPNLVFKILIPSNMHFQPALAATSGWGRRSVVMHGRAGTAWLQAPRAVYDSISTKTFCAFAYKSTRVIVDSMFCCTNRKEAKGVSNHACIHDTSVCIALAC